VADDLEPPVDAVRHRAAAEEQEAERTYVYQVADEPLADRARGAAGQERGRHQLAEQSGVRRSTTRDDDD
jgi:hypothetical protein